MLSHKIARRRNKGTIGCLPAVKKGIPDYQSRTRRDDDEVNQTDSWIIVTPGGAHRGGRLPAYARHEWSYKSNCVNGHEKRRMTHGYRQDADRSTAEGL